MPPKFWSVKNDSWNFYLRLEDNPLSWVTKKRFHTFNDNPDWLRENCRNNVKCNDSVLREEHLKNSFWPDALGKGEIIGFKLKELACRSLQISFN